MLFLGRRAEKAEEIHDLTDDVVSEASGRGWGEGAIFLFTTKPGSGLCMGPGGRGDDARLLAAVSGLAKDPVLKGVVLGSSLVIPVSGNGVRTEGQSIYLVTLAGPGDYAAIMYFCPFANR